MQEFISLPAMCVDVIHPHVCHVYTKQEQPVVWEVIVNLCKSVMFCMSLRSETKCDAAIDTKQEVTNSTRI